MVIHSECLYSIEDIPSFKIDYRGLIDYAHSIGKTVAQLGDDEKNMYIEGASMEEVRSKMLS